MKGSIEMAKLEELFKDAEFVEKLENCKTESDMEALRDEYADSIEIDTELAEDDLDEVAGGGKVCEFLGNCKYVCTECGKTFATEFMGSAHWFTMSFKGGGLRHTIKEI